LYLYRVSHLAARPLQAGLVKKAEWLNENYILHKNRIL